MSGILGFLNKTNQIVGTGRVAINDMKIIGDKAQDLLTSFTALFNSVLNSPLESNQNTGFGNTGNFGTTQGGFGQSNQNFSQGNGFGTAPQQTPSFTQNSMSPIQNNFKRTYRMENINTLADALDATAGQKNFDITHGKYGRDAITPAYTIASNIFLYYNNGKPRLHFNIDAKAKVIRDDKKIKLMESISALLTFIETMFSVHTPQSSTGNTYGVKLQDNNVVVDFNGVLFGIGTLALMKYKLGLSGYAYGSSAVIDDCIITVSGDYINLTKQGYTPCNVSRERFITILEEIPALKYTNISEADYIEYQDNPRGLTTRMIIELNRATNQYEIIAYEDIQFLDTYAGTQIRNSLLGTELKRSEGQNIV